MTNYKAPTLRAAQTVNRPSGVSLHVEGGLSNQANDPLSKAAYSNRHNQMQFQPGVYHDRRGTPKAF